jgi:23S rRNA (guanine745-N1)-methyltransferase
MLAARRDFFDAAHYAQLADAMAVAIVDSLPSTDAARSGEPRVVLDAGCGEGYYVRQIRSLLATRHVSDVATYGFDISKHGVKIAAKRDNESTYAVASSYRMPIADQSVDALVTHFSPIAAPEFVRVLRPGGSLFVGSPGEHHLYGLKSLLYETPELHEPAVDLSPADGFQLVAAHDICYEITLDRPVDILNLVKMTPFYWTIGPQRRLEIEATSHLTTDVHVVLHHYRLL